MSDAELAGTLTSWAENHQSEILDVLRELVALDAPTHVPELLDGTADLLEDRLASFGAKVTRHPTEVGTHLEARLGPAGEAPIMILGHYDTVWPLGTAAARPLRVEDGRVAGPGVFDMRGGVTAALNALRALHELDLFRRPVCILLTADEEAGSETSRGLIETLGTQASTVLIPEPSLANGGLKTERRGVLTYRFEATGREAHAGLDPERGVSAVRELVSAIGRIERLADPAAGTQVNVGVIGGGTRSNVIPRSAFAIVDVRIARLDEYERMRTEMTALEGQTDHPEATLTVETMHARPPMERTPAIVDAAVHTKEIARLMGLELSEGAAGGGSDGNFLSPLGVRVVDGLGPAGNGAHAVDEFIVLRSLEERTALIALLILLL